MPFAALLGKKIDWRPARAIIRGCLELEARHAPAHSWFVLPRWLLLFPLQLESGLRHRLGAHPLEARRVPYVL